MKNYLTILLLFITSATFAQKTNFSGSYQIKAEKIEWGPAPRYILPISIKVNSSDSQLIMIRDWDDGQGNVRADTLIFKGDGKPYVYTSKKGNKHRTILHWSDNGKTFSLTSQATDPAAQPVGFFTEDWSLSADGNELVIVRSVDQQTNAMKYTIKAYFAKK